MAGGPSIAMNTEEPAPETHVASLTEMICSDRLVVVVNSRVVDVPLMIVCCTPSDHVIVKGAVPVSVTGIETVVDAQV